MTRHLVYRTSSRSLEEKEWDVGDLCPQGFYPAHLQFLRGCGGRAHRHLPLRRDDSAIRLMTFKDGLISLLFLAVENEEVDHCRSERVLFE